MHSAKCVNEPIWVSVVKLNIWPLPKFTRISKMNYFFSEGLLGHEKPITYKSSWEQWNQFLEWFFKNLPIMPLGIFSCYSNEFEHMTKMTAMPIYSGNPLKISFSGNSGYISIKLVMQPWGLPFIIVCSNDEPGIDLDQFYTKGRISSLMIVLEMWKQLIFKIYCSISSQCYKIQSTLKVNNGTWVSRIKIICLPWGLSVSRIKTCFSLKLHRKLLGIKIGKFIQISLNTKMSTVEATILKFYMKN